MERLLGRRPRLQVQLWPRLLPGGQIQSPVSIDNFECLLYFITNRLRSDSGWIISTMTAAIWSPSGPDWAPEPPASSPRPAPGTPPLRVSPPTPPPLTERETPHWDPLEIRHVYIIPSCINILHHNISMIDCDWSTFPGDCHKSRVRVWQKEIWHEHQHLWGLLQIGYKIGSNQ